MSVVTIYPVLISSFSSLCFSLFYSPVNRLITRLVVSIEADLQIPFLTYGGLYGELVQQCATAGSGAIDANKVAGRAAFDEGYDNHKYTWVGVETFSQLLMFLFRADASTVRSASFSLRTVSTIFPLRFHTLFLHHLLLSFVTARTCCPRLLCPLFHIVLLQSNRYQTSFRLCCFSMQTHKKINGFCTTRQCCFLHAITSSMRVAICASLLNLAPFPWPCHACRASTLQVRCSWALRSVELFNSF